MKTGWTWAACKSLDCWITWGFEWQTLLAGLLAVGAAIYAGRFVQAQIDQVDRHERERRTRRYTAARATLPLTLSSLTGYAVAMCEALKKFHRSYVSTGGGVLLAAPDAPTDVIAALERMIEAADHPDLVTLIRRALAELQLLHSRAVDLNRMHVSGAVALDNNAETYIVQCAVIYAQAAGMFDFARFRSNELNTILAWADVYSALSILGVEEPEFEKLFDMCRRFEDRGTMPESVK